MTTVRLRWASVIGVLAALAYSCLPIEAILGFPLSESTDMLSDLGVAGTPTQPAFAGNEIAAGLLMIALAALAWRAASGRIERATLSIVALLGALSIGDALAPLPCPALPGGSCPAVGTAGAPGAGTGPNLITFLHSVTSVGASVLGVALGVALIAVAHGWLGARRRPRALRAWAWVLAAIGLATTLALSVWLAMPTTTGLYAGGTGIVQRLQSAVAAAQLLLVAPMWRGRPT